MVSERVRESSYRLHLPCFPLCHPYFADERLDIHVRKENGQRSGKCDTKKKKIFFRLLLAKSQWYDTMSVVEEPGTSEKISVFPRRFGRYDSRGGRMVDVLSGCGLIRLWFERCISFP